MNQILGNVFFKNNNYYKKDKKKFKYILYISVSIIFICIICYVILKYNSIKKEKIAKNLVSQYSITTLYNSNTNYTTSSISQQNTQKDPFVIGLIKIDKIKLMYPILSECSKDLLEIAPCRFYGPMPNEAGNLCIAGHNYVDNKLFSKIHLLEVNDIINLYDLNGKNLEYIVYKKDEVKKEDTSCLNQNTNGIREITLITCNNVKGTRVIIKAKENR